MPDKPKRQLILEAMKARFAGIDGDPDYTYTFSANDVKPWAMNEPSDDDLPLLAFKDDEDEVIEPESLGFGDQGTLRATLPIKIVAAVLAPAGTPTSEAAAEQARMLLADLIKACGVDQTWGEVAEWTQIKSTRVNVEGSETFQAWAELKIEVSYTFQRWDYTA